MTPSEALASPVFRAYAAIGLGVLVAAGAVIFALGRFTKKDLHHARQSYLAWVIMTPLAFGAIFLGRGATITLFTTLAVFGFKEFARATGLYRDWPMTLVVYLAIIGVGVTSLVHDPASGAPGWYGLFMAMPVYGIAAIMLVPIVRNRAQGQLQALSLAILGFTYFGWMFGHLAYLANSAQAYAYLLFLLFSVELADVAAYAVGRSIGRHRMRSVISPGKTWEGSAGALAAAMLFSLAMWWTMPHFSAWMIVLVGAIVGIGGQVGDLAVSVVKRDVGVKDMGRLLPGHGGILDRIDSLIYTAPLFLHLVRYVHDLR
ncbi:MAG: hypothetical protein FJ253_09665 [Phycisphaerae bacterium]|nr:hypothetical protein [Phycisphaerae bacterium]